MDCLRCAPLLSAHLDGELSVGDEADLVAHLQSCPRCTRAWQDLQVLRAGLRAHVWPQPELAALRSQVQVKLAARSTRPWPGPTGKPAGRWWAAWRPALAGAVLGASAMGLGFTAWGPAGEQDMSDVAVSAYLRSTRLAAQDSLRSDDAQAVAAWLQTRLQRVVVVPDLQSRGYRLVGARLDFLYRQQVAALVYQLDSHVVNVYLWPQGQQAALQADLAEAGLHLRFWTLHGQHRCAISDLDAAALQRFVQAFDA
jgi:anti-sigma factor RsiW